MPTNAETWIPMPQRQIRRESVESSPWEPQASALNAALNVGLGRMAAEAISGSGT
ncbi:MAG: hypothetical protein QOI86_733 [Actinomycetota bacterium]|jgi:hypothetical protein|nr:hypothetical protein [Actinomycetota bacterium]